MLDMLGPGIDERDVLTRLRHMGTGIPADGPRSDDYDFPAHGSPCIFLVAANTNASAHSLQRLL
jgi:hypothetical protein